MREILFRGQTRKLGEKVRVGDGAPVPGHWVYGGVLQGKGDHSIIYETTLAGHFLGASPVHSDTISQFTGMFDMHDERIWEGDIVQYYGNGWDEEDGPGVIKWDEDIAGFIIENNGLIVSFDNCYTFEIEVIGNIWDNPELLGVGE